MHSINFCKLCLVASLTMLRISDTYGKVLLIKDGLTPVTRESATTLFSYIGTITDSQEELLESRIRKAVFNKTMIISRVGTRVDTQRPFTNVIKFRTDAFLTLLLQYLGPSRYQIYMFKKQDDVLSHEDEQCAALGLISDLPFTADIVQSVSCR